jgi:hypothetical protein
VVLLVGLQHVVLEVREQLSHARVHAFVLDVGVDRQQLEHLVDELAAAGVRLRAGALELAEQPSDLDVVLLEDDDGVGRHGRSP